MSRLREVLNDLIGAEVQEHEVKFGKKSKKLRFRQITDAEGQAIYTPGPEVEGEDASTRGRRSMVKLVAASLLSDDDADGSKLSNLTTEERAARVAEADKLPGSALIALYNKAALTNGIMTVEDEEEAETPEASTVAGESAPKG